MNPRIALALLLSATLMVACGTTPNAPLSGSVKPQALDGSGGGGENGGMPTGTLLGSPYPQGTFLATFPRSSSPYQTFTMDWQAVGFSYGWYDSPGVELRVCSYDTSGALLSCTQQSASGRYGVSDRFVTTLGCAPAQNAAWFAVYGSDTALHPAGRAIYATSVRSTDGLPPLPGPFPPNRNVPNC
jgi:hypothetical protein